MIPLGDYFAFISYFCSPGRALQEKMCSFSYFDQYKNAMETCTY
jgi:hypothetical protein